MNVMRFLSTRMSYQHDECLQREFGNESSSFDLRVFGAWRTLLRAPVQTIAHPTGISRRKTLLAGIPSRAGHANRHVSLTGELLSYYRESQKILKSSNSRPIRTDQ